LLKHHVHRTAIRRHIAHALAADRDVALIRCDESAIMRSSVVLPQPDGPRIEKKLPRSTLNDKESTAT
jgi:hypothetical protein